MKEPEDFHRLKISNAFIIVLTSWSLYISTLNRLYMILKDAVFKKTHVRPSAYLERRTRKRRQGANIMNKTSGRIYL